MSTKIELKSREVRKKSGFKKMYGFDSHQVIVLIGLFDGLDHGYTSRIQAKCAETDLILTKQTVRHVKNGNSKNWKVLNYLIEDAKTTMDSTDQALKVIKEIQSSL